MATEGSERASSPRQHGERVDVCIVTFNTAELTVEALHHLLNAEPGLDLRVLVHDNASSDGTADAIRRLVPDVEVHASERNLGFAAGVNALLRRTTAPWVLLLNSDAWPEPGAISRLLATAEAHPRAAAVAPRLERPDGTLEVSAHPFPSLSVAAACAVGGIHRVAPRWAEHKLLPHASEHRVPRVVDWVVGAALLIRRAALDEIGGLDERFFMYAEDLAWCWKAHDHGWEVRYDPAAIVRHIGGVSAERPYAGGRRERAHLSNALQVYRDHHGAGSALAYRLLNAAGAGRLWLRARLRRDPGEAALWAVHVKAHLRPRRGPDAGPVA